jgi:hypothetical protein
VGAGISGGLLFNRPSVSAGFFEKLCASAKSAAICVSVMARDQ